MNNSILCGIVNGRFWTLKCLLILLLCTLFFTCAPAIFIAKDLRLPPAYALKAERPFADTAKLTIPEHAGERSHGAKLTPRLVGSIFLWIAQKSSCHPYFPATIFGLIYLLSGVLVAYYITGDRIVGLFTGLLFSGLYASSACFSINWMPKPFDGIAIGLLGATLIAIQRLWLLPFMAFLSCWTDERSIVALCFIMLVILVWPSMAIGAKIQRGVLLAISVIAYGITRMIIANVLGWGSPDTSMIGINLILASSFFQLAAWSAFEGGWIILIYTIRMLVERKLYSRLLLTIANIALGLISSLLVLDVSRSTMFMFPLILAFIAILKDNDLKVQVLRGITGTSAAITLLAPNFEIISGIAVKWLPSYLVFLLLN